MPRQTVNRGRPMVRRDLARPAITIVAAATLSRPSREQKEFFPPERKDITHRFRRRAGALPKVGKQLELELAVADPEVRRRRTRRVRRAVREARARQPSLIEAPVTERCGFCGRLTTLHGRAAACEGCGSVVMRRREEP